jgi:hypothetical protein
MEEEDYGQEGNNYPVITIFYRLRDGGRNGLPGRGRQFNHVPWGRHGRGG